MIVIATNNTCVEKVCRGSNLSISNFLERLLNSIENVKYTGDVLVVDTGSDDLKTMSYLNDLKSKKINYNFNLIVDKTPGNNYSTGAYIYAFENYISDYYIFLQDSVEIKDDRFISHIENLMTSNNAVCWVKQKGGIGIDDEEQFNFIKECIGEPHIPGRDLFIFGPIFFIKREVFSKIYDQIKIKPSLKTHDSGMERAFGTLFTRNNIDVIAIESDQMNFGAMADDHFNWLRKHHAARS